MAKRVTTQEIVAATGLSRATVDRVLNNRPGVHPRTRVAVEGAILELERPPVDSVSFSAAEKMTSMPPKHFQLIVQTGDAFTQKLSQEVDRIASISTSKNYKLDVCTFNINNGDAALISHLRNISPDIQGIAVIAKNTQAITYELSLLRARKIPVVTLVSDVDLDARDCYIGIDNRAAGQAVAYLMGQHFRRLKTANVAVVVGSFSYICHEDREIGFRSLLRTSFPHVKIVDVIKGDDSAEATYLATKSLLAANSHINGIYNVGGGNDGLAKALVEAGRNHETLFVTHEVNLITDRLLRDDIIDYVINQDLEKLVNATVDQLVRLSSGIAMPENCLIPSHILCKYMLP